MLEILKNGRSRSQQGDDRSGHIASRGIHFVPRRLASPEAEVRGRPGVSLIHRPGAAPRSVRRL